MSDSLRTAVIGFLLLVIVPLAENAGDADKQVVTTIRQNVSFYMDIEVKAVEEKAKNSENDQEKAELKFAARNKRVWNSACSRNVTALVPIYDTTWNLVLDNYVKAFANHVENPTSVAQPAVPDGITLLWVFEVPLIKSFNAEDTEHFVLTERVFYELTPFKSEMLADSNNIKINFQITGDDTNPDEDFTSADEKVVADEAANELLNRHLSAVTVHLLIAKKIQVGISFRIATPPPSEGNEAAGGPQRKIIGAIMMKGFK